MAVAIMVGLLGVGMAFSRKHKCFTCGESFDKKEDLELHVEGVHDGKVKFNPEAWNKFKKEEMEAKQSEHAERTKPESKRIGLFFPKETYSMNKDAIKKLIKVHCQKWNGGGWEGEKVSIEAVFKKTMEKLGQPYDYDGDQLWISGNVDLMRGLIELAKNLGAEVKE